jgi:hypothetical protein
MSEIDSLQAEYVKLRAKGLDAKTALSRLRADIVGLELAERDQLLALLRRWEMTNAAKHENPDPSATRPVKLELMQPLMTPQSPAVTQTPPVASKPPAPTKVNCPHCGKPNNQGEIICYSCGQLLTTERSIFATRHFDNELDEMGNDEAFGPTATLVLVVKGSQEHYRIRPQEKRHEIVIGRSAGGTMQPDVDLGPHQADELGVSRMHLSITYNEKHGTLSAADMDSANGTFINGQRLHPEEKRVLRHGDELRLGKLTIMVYFYRPKTPIAQ